MTTQITVRLPEALVAFVDAAVAEGRAESRTSYITRALELEHRRVIEEREVEILRSERAVLDRGDDPDDLRGFEAWLQSRAFPAVE